MRNYNIRHVLLVGGVIAAIIGACILFLFNPETTSYYPRCPFYLLTGLQCPGCGTSRGLHALLHLRLATAWRFNPAMVISIPVIIACVCCPRLRRSAIFSWSVLALILIWWVARNF